MTVKAGNRRSGRRPWGKSIKRNWWMGIRGYVCSFSPEGFQKWRGELACFPDYSLLSQFICSLWLVSPYVSLLALHVSALSPTQLLIQVQKSRTVIEDVWCFKRWPKDTPCINHVPTGFSNLVGPREKFTVISHRTLIFLCLKEFISRHDGVGWESLFPWQLLLRVKGKCHQLRELLLRKQRL